MSRIIKKSRDCDIQSERFRKLYIGGLNYDTTEETMKEYFEKWGELVSYFIGKHRKNKKSKGFGFIIYKTAEMLDDAQNNRPHKIDGREVVTKRAFPHYKYSTEILFAHGINDDTTKDDLHKVFDPFGKIEKIDVIRDKNTGKQKDFCFITFEDFDSVDKCVLRQQFSVGGRYVIVQKGLLGKRDYAIDGGQRGYYDDMRDRGGFYAGSNYNSGYRGNQGYPGNIRGVSGPQDFNGVGNRCAFGGEMAVRSNFPGNPNLFRNPQLPKKLQVDLLLGLNSLTHLLKMVQICVDAESNINSQPTDRTQRCINST